MCAELEPSESTPWWHHGYCKVWTDKVLLSPRRHDFSSAETEKSGEQTISHREGECSQKRKTSGRPRHPPLPRMAPGQSHAGKQKVAKCGINIFFKKDSFSPCKMIFDPSFFNIFFSSFLEHLLHKIPFLKDKEKSLALNRNQRKKGAFSPSQLLKKLAV